MQDTGVREAIESLVASDPDVADREELGAMIRTAKVVRGWLDAADVRFARRSRELSEQGAVGSASLVLLDESRRSGKEIGRTQDREQLCSQMPGFEDALAAGAVTADHVDALARLSKNLTDVERSDLAARADDLVAAATKDYVAGFELRCKGVIAEIREQHRPNSDAAELDAQRAASKVSRWVDKPTGMHKTLIELDPLRDASMWKVIDAQLATLRQTPGNESVPFQQLRVDAVVAAMSTGEAATRVPEVCVLIDLDTLQDGRHGATVCETDNGVQLPVSTVRRLCCDAAIISVVLGADGEVLDVGREERTANRAQRRALRAMYRSCAHPHCTVGFDQCRIHHLRWWWEHNGPTDLDNLIPLCERCHHLVHEGGWTLTMTPDRVTTWVRPDRTVWWTGSSINRTPPNPHKRPVDESTHRQPRLVC